MVNLPSCRHSVLVMVTLGRAGCNFSAISGSDANALKWDRLCYSHLTKLASEQPKESFVVRTPSTEFWDENVPHAKIKAMSEYLEDVRPLCLGCSPTMLTVIVRDLAQWRTSRRRQFWRLIHHGSYQCPETHRVPSPQVKRTIWRAICASEDFQHPVGICGKSCNQDRLQLYRKRSKDYARCRGRQVLPDQRPSCIGEGAACSA